MPMTDCVFDLDDFCDTGMDNNGSRLSYLIDLKEIYSGLKVTLFTVPARCSLNFLKRVKSHNWIELAVHGFAHADNWECEKWTTSRTHNVLNAVERMELFVKGFKAPGWQINQDVCRVLKERGYWLMHHSPHKKDLEGIDMPVYWTYHPWMLHGHMQPIISKNPQYRNGLMQLTDSGQLDWNQDTVFHFVSEMVE